jgi:diguanylate cyclase (GGDEF)-like protein
MTSHLKTLFEESSQRGKPLSVLLLDIDYFKAVNDGYGHDAGDSVLREFAARVRRNIRGIDLACRLGGEEFVVVMPDTDLAKAYLVGERLRQCIAVAPFYAGERIGTLEVTASVGVAALEFADNTPELILKRADQALYCAKRDGRNRVVADAATVPPTRGRDLANHFRPNPWLSVFAKAPRLDVVPEGFTLRVYNGSHFIVLRLGIRLISSLRWLFYDLIVADEFDARGKWGEGALSAMS